MSLREARAKYYANQFDDESSEENWEEPMNEEDEETSSEEYYQPRVDPRERLRKRLEQIQFDFKRAAPHEVAAERFHLHHPRYLENEIDFDEPPQRQTAYPILSALSKPAVGTENMAFGYPATEVIETDMPQKITMEEVLPSVSIDEIDKASGIPQNNDEFHLWLAANFGQENVPKVQCNPLYPATNNEIWDDWPKIDDWPTDLNDVKDPSPMEVKSNKLSKKLSDLQTTLRKIDENMHVLAVEKENLLTQINACDKRMYILEQDHVAMEIQIEQVKEKQAKHIAEIDELQSQNERKKCTTRIISEIRLFMDDFSQAVQILLGSRYSDFDHLIRAHVKDNGYSTLDVKNAIIKEAKLLKRDQLYSSLEADNCYLAPKNADGLPNLFDQYITDSYDIVTE